MSTFIDELDDHVRAINANLLDLEKSDSDEEQSILIAQLFRSAHSLKGAARAVDVGPVQRICHEMEELFREIQDGKVPATPDVYSLLFASADAVETAGMQLREKVSIEESQSVELCPLLKLASQGQPFVLTTKGANEETTQPTESETASIVDRKEPDTASIETDVETATDKSQSKTRDSTVRVAESKLDSLMAHSGELLVTRQRIDSRPSDAEELVEFVARWKTDWQRVERVLRGLAQNGSDPLLARSPRLTRELGEVVEQTGANLRQLEKRLDRMRQELASDSRKLKSVSTGIQDDVHRIRMFPFSDACAGLERAVRDLANSLGKEVRLEIEGGDLEMDRAVLDALKDPLLHLIRNSMDHGIEATEDRLQAGKFVPATIKVSAQAVGPQVLVTVSDDGCGIDRERVRQKLMQKGLTVPADDDELLRTLFQPGFSTAEIVTDVSGRGVGLDVVGDTIRALQGTVDIVSDEQAGGTTFRLLVPTTLTTISAMFVKVADQIYAIPNSHIRRLVRFSANETSMMHGRSVVKLGDVPLTVVELASMLELPSSPTAGKRVGLQLTAGDREAVIVVDEIVMEQEATIMPLGPRIQRVPNVSGAIMLRTGRLALLLNVANLVDTAFRSRVESRLSEQPIKDTSAAERRLIVADDSVTTRTLLKTILETAGYKVTSAIDGRDAWNKLQSSSYDLLVSDVDMPNMTGFELVQTIRGSQSHRQLPVILLTSRGEHADVARGAQVGADAYLVKSTFDQSKVLSTIQQLL